MDTVQLHSTNYYKEGLYNMRCVACNKALNDFEATRKSVITGEYLDLCNHCFHDVETDVQSLVREDLRNEESFDEDLELDDLQGDLFDGIQE